MNIIQGKLNFFSLFKRNFLYRLKSKINIDNHPDFKLIHHDVVEPIHLEVDWIFNLACPASPVHYQSNPIKTAKTNVIGTLNMLDLAEKVIKQTKSNSKIIFKPLPKNDPMKRKPDISLAKEKLNFSPEITIDLGLSKTIDYFKD